MPKLLAVRPNATIKSRGIYVSTPKVITSSRFERFVENGIKLRSGQTLEADLIVTATGLKVKFFGGIKFDVDGRALQPSETMIYKGMMCSDVPNLAFAVGYTNASWTLKCDLTARYVCRLLNYMDAKHYTTCTPRRDPSVAEQPIINFSSGYVQRALANLPKQGDVVPWKLYQNYVLDLLAFRLGALDDGVLEFTRRVPTHSPPA